jgi:tol-pal system protein YbgF
MTGFAKKFKIFKQLLTLRLVLLLIIGGCAPQKDVMKKQIRDLERHIARLKAEQANWSARSNSLDDKIIVLKKRLEKCQEQNSPKLRVVRLTPDDEAEISENSADRFLPEPERYISQNSKKKSSKRPKLKLDESGKRWALKPQNPQNEPMPQHPAHGLETDNLGVVTLDGKIAAETAPNHPDPMETFNDAYRAYLNKRYEEALDKFSEFVRDNPNNEYADNALFWRGECYLATSNFLKAIGEFERVVRRYPKSEKVPAGLYRIGFVYDHLHDRHKALEYYYKVVDKYPSTDAAKRASNRVSMLRSGEGQMSGLTSTAAER